MAGGRAAATTRVRGGGAVGERLYSLSDPLADSCVSPSALSTVVGDSDLTLRGRRGFGLASATAGAAASITGSFTSAIAGMAAARRPRTAAFLGAAALRVVAGARATGLRAGAALRVEAALRAVTAVFRVLAAVFRVAVLRAVAVAVLRAAVAVLRGVAILRAAAAGLRAAADLRAVVVAGLRVAAVLRDVVVVFAAARFGAGAGLRGVTLRAAGLRDAAVLVAAPRRLEAAVVFVAAGLRAEVVAFLATARAGVFAVFAAGLVALDAGFDTGLRVVAVFVAVAARFAGARRVEALTAIARARGADPVSPVLS